MERFNIRAFAVVLAIALSAGVADSRTLLTETFKGIIEVSASSTTPMVAVSVDFQAADGKSDGFVDAIFFVQLLPAEGKPEAMKTVGEVRFEARQYLQVVSAEKTYSFVVPPVEAGRATSAYLGVAADLTKGRTVAPLSHREAAQFFLAQKSLPYKRPPR